MDTKKLNSTSTTDFSCKTLCIIFFGSPCMISHELHNYCARVGGEELTQVYPNFPLWRKWALHKIDLRQDVKSQKRLLSKRLPNSCSANICKIICNNIGATLKIPQIFAQIYTVKKAKIYAPKIFAQIFATI